MSTKAWTILRLFLILTIFTLACSSSTPEGETPAGGDTDQPVLTGTEEVKTSAVQLGSEFRSSEGGYAFNVVPGYTLEEFAGIVSLFAPGADPVTGPQLTLIGGINDERMTADQLLDQFTGELEEEGEVSNQDTIIVDGIPGIAVDFEATVEGMQALGRAAFFAVTPNQVFSAVGISPPNQMTDEFELIFDALLASVTFFGPEEGIANDDEGTSEPAEVVKEPPGEPIRQWATSATASSQYSEPDYSAMQATGAPDTIDCGDRPTAWASLEYFTIDWLEVGFETPVFPREVNIYESHTPSQVVLVELVDTAGGYHEIYTAEPEMQIDCPFVLSIEVADIDYPVLGVKITVDQSQLDLPLDEIDAVELVGYQSSDEDVSEQAGKTTELVQSNQQEEPGRETEATEAKKPTQPAKSPSTIPVDAADLSGWSWTNYTSADGLADDRTMSIAVAADGAVWSGNFNVGVSRIKDGSITNFGVEDGLGFANGLALAVEPDGSVWAGTTVGLGFFDGNNWKNYTRADGLVYETVQALELASDGTLWVGTAQGASQYDGREWTNYKKEDGLVDNNILDIALDNQSNPWFATLGGVSYFDGENWTSYTEEDGLAYDITRAIAVAPDRSIWVGTSSKGVSRFDGSNWTTYTVSDDYDLLYVKAIIVDSDGALWFTTEGEGIYRFDGENWINIRKADGMPDDYVDAAAVAPDGVLWFGFRKEGVGRFGE